MLTIPRASAETLSSSGTASRSETLDAIRKFLPEIVERAHDDRFLRASLVADPKITIESLLSKSFGDSFSIPDFCSIKVLEESSSKMHLLIPSSYDGVEMEDGENPLMEVLLAATSDVELRGNLIHNTRVTLEAELLARTGDSVQIPEYLDVEVHAQDMGEVIIVLPVSTPDRINVSSVIEGDWDIDTLNPIEMSTSCFSCTCFSASSCFTGQCFSSQCFSFSSDCNR